MRDLLIAGFIFVGLIATLRKPWQGAILWIVISVLNPHLLGVTMAKQPVAAVVAATTVFAALIRRADFSIPWKAPLVWFTLFTAWMCITWLVSGALAANYEMWDKVMKINFMLFVVYSLIVTRRQIDWVIWAIAGSLCYYGVKGGVFTILTAGAYRVWGPDGTFIAGNNEIALALIIGIPLLWYLRFTLKNRWLRLGMLAAMLLCAIAALGSHSRGALLALIAMTLFFWVRSRHKAKIGLAILCLAPILLGLMSQGWEERMATIQTYEEDRSAMGRINAWWMAYNLAKANFFGGSFETATPIFFALYAPDPTAIHGPHSIYFQTLGSHGFLGLFLFLAMWLSTWMTCNRVRKLTRDKPEKQGDFLLASMIQVSLAGFAVGGAFLGLAYFDMPYFLMAMALRLLWLEEKEAKATGAPLNPVTSPPPWISSGNP
ncbi:MAG: putative O-glycosylation ligase, exosortase A system-associated [Azonexus sp.]|jgi:probable O-glycosylation ligase (exosortase A-associated)|nr:putative O-glycosylation ligase, exosortase A system-associated [Azonexus sp.]